MAYAISWLLVMLLFGLWSVTVFALHAVASWTLTQAGAIGAGKLPAISELPLPDWLAPWLPAEWAQAAAGALASFGPLLDGLLKSLPTLMGGLSGATSVVAWLVWGLGALILLVLGAGLHGLIAVWRRRNRHPVSHAAPVFRAG